MPQVVASTAVTLCKCVIGLTGTNGSGLVHAAKELASGGATGVAGVLLSRQHSTFPSLEDWPYVTQSELQEAVDTFASRPFKHLAAGGRDDQDDGTDLPATAESLTVVVALHTLSNMCAAAVVSVPVVSTSESETAQQEDDGAADTPTDVDVALRLLVVLHRPVGIALRATAEVCSTSAAVSSKVLTALCSLLATCVNLSSVLRASQSDQLSTFLRSSSPTRVVLKWLCDQATRRASPMLLSLNEAAAAASASSHNGTPTSTPGGRPSSSSGSATGLHTPLGSGNLVGAGRRRKTPAPKHGGRGRGSAGLVDANLAPSKSVRNQLVRRASPAQACVGGVRRR